MNDPTQPQFFSFHIDLGQLIITSLIAIVGWFVKAQIEDFKTKITKHEDMFFQMNALLQRIVGHLGVSGGNSFRKDDFQ